MLVSSQVEQTAAVPMRWAFNCLGDLEQIAIEEGGVQSLLDKTWRKVNQAKSPRVLFTTSELRAAKLFPCVRRMVV